MSAIKNLDQNKILGKGRYGTVFQFKWNEKLVALKRIELSDIVGNQEEEEALQKLVHPNVIKLLHVESDTAYRYYFLELCQASMDKLFLKDEDPQKYRGPMPPIMEVLDQLAVGLEYIHAVGLVHRDIKPENVLISVNTQKVLMKWADFGQSKPANERGTFNWLAPELILWNYGLDSEAAREEKLSGTVQTDVFAEGLVFGYFLLDGLHPYGSPDQTANNIITNKPVNLPKIRPKYARDLIEKMLGGGQSKERITSSDVVQELAKQISAKEEQIMLQTELLALCSGPIYPIVDSINNLLEKRFDVNCVDENGWTPLLHLAVWKNNVGMSGDHFFQLLRLLMRNGIDINCKDVQGRNALHFFSQYYKKENLIDIIRLLIKNGIDVNCKDNYGWNILTLLCIFNGNENLIDIVRLLIGNGIDVNCKNKDENNAFTLLCRRHYQNENSIDIILLLIENGIDVNCKNKDGNNALTLLCIFNRNENFIDIIRLLIENGIDVNCINKDGNNALTLLCRHYQNENLIDIIRLLIENGIDVNCINKDGNNAFTLLSRNSKIATRGEILELIYPERNRKRKRTSD